MGIIYSALNRVIETKSGVQRYDGKVLMDVPKVADLPPGVRRCKSPGL